MGMALDEPQEDDTRIETASLTFLMDPQAASLVGQNGGLLIDYVDDGGRKGYVVTLGSRLEADDCGGCGGGHCG